MARIIDIHTHFFPKENLEELLRTFGEDYWLSLLFPKEGRTLQGFPSQAEFIADMDEANIAVAIINGAYWQSQEACEYFNEQALDFARQYPRRIVPLAMIKPSEVDKSLGIIRGAKARGFVGVGELCDAVQGFEPLSDGFIEIVQACQEESLPICFHLSDELGKDYKGKAITNNDALFALAEKFPKQKFIFSHLGGGRAFSSFKFPKNIYLDTAAYPLLYKQEQWQVLSKSALSNLCFGTDYSLRIYPKSSAKENFFMLKEESLKHLDKSYHDSFLHLNARKIFDLDYRGLLKNAFD